MEASTKIAIEREDGPSGGIYRAHVDGHVAEMTFSRASAQLIIIDHKEVPEALRGRHIGPALVSHAVDEARKSGWKIYPLCPFAAAEFRRHREYDDVLSR